MVRKPRCSRCHSRFRKERHNPDRKPWCNRCRCRTERHSLGRKPPHIRCHCRTERHNLDRKPSHKERRNQDHSKLSFRSTLERCNSCCRSYSDPTCVPSARKPSLTAEAYANYERAENLCPFHRTKSPQHVVTLQLVRCTPRCVRTMVGSCRDNSGIGQCPEGTLASKAEPSLVQCQKLVSGEGFTQRAFMSPRCVASGPCMPILGTLKTVRLPDAP